MFRRALMVGVALTLAASVAWAQGPGGPGGPGGRGPGGRGPGFGGAGGFGGPTMLLAIPEVQAELGLSDEQKAQLETLSNDTREAMRGTFGGGNFREMTQEQREQAFAAAREKMEAVRKEAEAKLDKILTDKQQERLEQLRLQREGLMALARPEVVSALGLTAEQQEKIAKIREELRPQRPEGGADQDRAEMFRQMRERGEKMQADIMAVLTDAQKAKLEEMKGAAFEFPRRGFGGERGGRDGGRDGERGNRGERRRPST